MIGINISRVVITIQIAARIICESVLSSQVDWKVPTAKLSPGHIVGTNRMFLNSYNSFHSSKELKGENTLMCIKDLLCSKYCPKCFPFNTLPLHYRH